MALSEALRVSEALAGAGCRWWLERGWGVDALAGRQTRPHRDVDVDVDVDVDASCEATVLSALTCPPERTHVRRFAPDLGRDPALWTPDDPPSQVWACSTSPSRDAVTLTVCSRRRYSPASTRSRRPAGRVADRVAWGRARPIHDQNASQIRSTWFLSSPVTTAAGDGVSAGPSDGARPGSAAGDLVLGGLGDRPHHHQVDVHVLRA